MRTYGQFGGACRRPVMGAVLAAGAVAMALHAPSAGAQDLVTPTPQLVPGSPCPAVVTLRWDVRGVPGANGILWELDDDAFTNPNGPEQDRLAVGTSGQLAGQVQLDLRQAGRVLDGSRYLLRVVAKNGNQDVALRSQPVVFDLERTADGTVAVAPVAGQPGRLEIDWSGLQGDIRGCSDAVFWEIKAGAGFLSLGPDQTRDDSGDAPIGAGRAVVDVTNLGEGSLYVRLVGKHGGLDFDSDVGRRGAGLRVELRAPAPVAPPVAPPPPVITSFDVGDPSVRAHLPGPVPFRFQATGRVDAYKVADCTVFDDRNVGFVPFDGSGLGGLTVELPAGQRTVCLEVRGGSGLSPAVSKRATDTIKIAEAPQAPVVTSVTLQRDGRTVGLADVGDPIEPVIRFTGTATHYRFGSCIGLADRPWGILPTNRRGELRAPEFSAQGEGLHDFCAQLLRVVPGQESLLSNTRNTQVEFLRRVVHDVPAREALELARRTGFGEDVDVLTEGATCEIDSDGGLRVDEGACRFHLFFGRPLNRRWEVEELVVLVDEDLYELEVERAPSGQAAEIRVVVEGREVENQFVFPGLPLPAPRLSFRPGLRIRLRGPADESWQRAFAR